MAKNFEELENGIRQAASTAVAEAPTKGEVLADRVANTLDLASATVLERIDAIVSEMQAMRTAIIADADRVKQEIQNHMRFSAECANVMDSKKSLINVTSQEAETLKRK